jgi:hypothetical protein
MKCLGVYGIPKILTRQPEKEDEASLGTVTRV